MKCPFCKEEIQDGAIKCKHCGEILDRIAYGNIKVSPENEPQAPIRAATGQSSCTGAASSAQNSSPTQPACTRAQTVGMICAIINLFTFFALPVLQVSVLKATMYDLADKVGGVTLSLWLIPIAASVYLFFFFERRTSVNPFLVKAVGGSLVIALLLIIGRAILFAEDNASHGALDFNAIFSQFNVFDVLGVGFYTSVAASGIALVYPCRNAATMPSYGSIKATREKGHCEREQGVKATDGKEPQAPIKPAEQTKTELPSHSGAAPSVDEIVARHGAGIEDSAIWFAPNIPAEKLQGAINSYAKAVSPSDVLMLLDNTLWGGCGDGMLITGDRVYSRVTGESPKVMRISEIKTVDAGGSFGRGVFINSSKFTPLQMTDKPNDIKICLLIAELASCYGYSSKRK